MQALRQSREEYAIQRSAGPIHAVPHDLGNIRDRADHVLATDLAMLNAMQNVLRTRLEGQPAIPVAYNAIQFGQF